MSQPQKVSYAIQVIDLQDLPKVFPSLTTLVEHMDPEEHHGYFYPLMTVSRFHIKFVAPYTKTISVDDFTEALRDTHGRLPYINVAF
jgi:hypothetical protein